MNKYEKLNQQRQFVETKKRVAAYCRVSTEKDSRSIRNEDTMRIMSLLMDSLEMEKETIVQNIISTIQSVAARNMGDTDAGSLWERLRRAEQKKERLIELYMGKDINRKEFTAARAKCNAEIDELMRLADGAEKAGETNSTHNKLISDINAAVNEIVFGMAKDEDFYRNLIDCMMVHRKSHVGVHLNLLPYKWSFAFADDINAINAL